MTTGIKFTLLLVAVAIVGLNILNISSEQLTAKQPSANQLDFYARGINTLRTDENGEPKNRLVASTMKHFELDDHTELENPVATLYADNSQPWVVRALTGHVSSEGKQITLSQNVSIEQNATDQNPATLITTEKLLLEPDRDYAETDQPIEFNQGKNRIRSTGMKGTITKPMQIELLSNVRGYYETR